MSRRPPEACRSLAELRHEIDRLDRDMVRLVAERARYINRAVVLKRAEGLPARIEPRIEEVVSNVRREATRQGLDPDTADRLWRAMMDHFIAFEERKLGQGGRSR